MDEATSALEADWLSACRRAVEAMSAMLAASPTTAERVVETGGTGSGGDLTLVIDASAEAIVFGELDLLFERGFRFCAVSEERGWVSFGSDSVRVVIDPIDGSLNAKRGLPHYALSLAVASGPTMADVELGYVYDFGQREEWWARRGEGAWLNSSKLDPLAAERRDDRGRLEMLGIESADPRWVQASIDALVERAYRIRALGSIASALCQVAAARLDGLVSLRNCRAVDAAAAQLIVREAGGFVSFPSCSPPLGCQLDAEPRSPVVAARSAQTLRSLEQVPVAG